MDSQTGGGHQAAGGPGASAQGGPKPPPQLPPDVAYDLSLQHERCVFQLLRRQFARYTPEMVERITGIPKEQFLKAADLFTSVRKDGDMKRVATIIYAAGWTHHTSGTQIIRTAAILQLLLGNVGRADFWRAPGASKEEMAKIQATVYQLPGECFAEKDGTFVNSARWLQWKHAALPPPGQAKVDQEILARIFLKVRELYQKEGGKFPDPILNLSWRYTTPENPSLAEVAKEINGRALADLTDPNQPGVTVKAGQQAPCFAWLRDDGTTECGNWLYSGSWTEAGAQMQRRGTEDPSGLGIYPNWGWSWPANRRVLYNRASCDPAGRPWDAERRQVWWEEAQARWVGSDVPDFKPDSNPAELRDRLAALLRDKGLITEAEFEAVRTVATSAGCDITPRGARGTRERDEA